MRFGILAFAVAATVSTTSVAQSDRMAPIGRGEATIYRDYGFRGPAVAVMSAKPLLGVVWPVRSMRVKSGVWQICALPNYRGECATIAASEPDLRRTGYRSPMVMSMRPTGVDPMPQPVEPVPPTTNARLRGMAAEFFTDPGRNGLRVAACPMGSATAACAARTADTFCREMGWNGSKSEALQSVGRTAYLADVLCTRTGY